MLYRVRIVLSIGLTLSGLCLLYMFVRGGVIMQPGFGNLLYFLAHSHLLFWLVLFVSMVVAGCCIYPRRQKSEPVLEGAQAEVPGEWPPAPKLP